MRHLVEFPAAVAEMLFGTTDPEQVTQRIRTFAESFDDLEDVVTSIQLERVIKAVLTADPVMSNRVFLYDLAPLSFESLGASVGWRIDHGEDPPEPVFIWVSCLCYHPSPEKGGGIRAAVQMLGEYILSAPRDDRILRLLLELCEAYVWERSWAATPDIFPLYAAVAVVMRQTERVEDMIRRKLRSGPPDKDFHLHLDTWFDVRRGEVVDSNLADVERNVTEREVSPPREELDQIRSCLTQVFRLIASATHCGTEEG